MFISMETNQTDKGRVTENARPGRALLPALLLVPGTLLLPVGLLLLPAWTAALSYRVRPRYAYGLILAFLLGAVNLYGWAGGVALTAAYAVPAALLRLLHKRGVPPYAIAAALSGTAFLLLYLAVCLPGILSGEGAFAAAEASFGTALEEYRAMLTAAAVGADITRILAVFDEQASLLLRNVSAILMPFFAYLAMALGVSNFLFFRLFTRRVPEIPRLAPFREWRIPAQLTGGICFFLIASLVLELTGARYGAAVTGTINAIVGVPLLIQGLSLIDYTIVWKSRNVRRTRIVAYVIIGLLFMLLRTTLILLGCAEQLFRLRDRAEGRIPKKPERPL